jgi:5'-deoxynucleotidase YfbR-like HD superfamily hydrolase
MAESDQLFRQARSELILGGPGKPLDLTLWEHSLRVVTNAEMIASLPALTGKRVDRQALRVAALYHDAGWAVQVAAGEIASQGVLARPTTDVQHELAAELIESSLKNQLPPRTVERAAQAIRGISNRRQELVEAHIIADADNLDQIGAIGLLQALRRSALEGRELRHLLVAWQRQQEYHYWEARIREGIRFQAVREIAWQRLAALEPFMSALAEQLDSKDLANLAKTAGIEVPRPSQEAL